MKKLNPVRYIQQDKDKIKDKITETISLDEEVKILRETLAKVLEHVEVNNIEEFQEYNNLITGIKSEIKS
jgi:hypothetical protein